MHWVFIGVAVLVYFLPGFIALGRRHPRVGGICGLNLALGWTLIGWFIALVWSLTRPQAETIPPEGAGAPESPPS